MKKILIVGAREDPHVRFPADAARETGEVIHFDYTEFPIIEIRDDDEISINSEIIDSKNLVILWRENLTYNKIDNIEFFDKTEKDFFTNQWNDVINFISFRVPVQNQINHRGRASAAGSKILSGDSLDQLALLFQNKYSLIIIPQLQVLLRNRSPFIKHLEHTFRQKIYLHIL